MTARSVIEALAGAVVGISAVLPETYDAAGYGSTDLVFTPIGEVENFGSHGMTSAVTEFTAIADAVVQKVKGSKNYGTKSFSVGNIPSDAGQALLKAASESTAHYSVRLQYPDGSLHYLDVLVTKFEYGDGAVNDVQKVNFDLAICRPPVIVPQV